MGFSKPSVCRAAANLKRKCDLFTAVPLEGKQKIQPENGSIMIRFIFMIEKCQHGFRRWCNPFKFQRGAEKTGSGIPAEGKPEPEKFMESE